jgi:DNA repair exonuclease SbcCD ATPase subunit
MDGEHYQNPHSHHAADSSNLNTARTLRALEDEEAGLRRSLLTLPSVAEDTKRGIEERAVQAKHMLQREADALNEEADGYRRRVRSARAAINLSREQLQAAQQTNSDLERRLAEAQRRAAESNARAKQLEEAVTARTARQAREQREAIRSPVVSPRHSQHHHGADTPSPSKRGHSHGHGHESPLAHGAASPQLNAEEAEAAVTELAKRHGALLGNVQDITDRLHKVTQRKAEIGAQLEGLRGAHLQLAAAKADTNVLEAAQLEKDHAAAVERLRALREETAALVKERKGMVEHLVDGFTDRSKTLVGTRRRAAHRLAAAAKNGGSDAALLAGSPGGASSMLSPARDVTSILDHEITASDTQRKSVSEIVRNAAAERAAVEGLKAVLQERLLDSRIRCEMEKYEYGLASGRFVAATHGTVAS